METGVRIVAKNVCVKMEASAIRSTDNVRVLLAITGSGARIDVRKVSLDLAVNRNVIARLERFVTMFLETVLLALKAGLVMVAPIAAFVMNRAQKFALLLQENASVSSTDLESTVNWIAHLVISTTPASRNQLKTTVVSARTICSPATLIWAVFVLLGSTVASSNNMRFMRLVLFLRETHCHHRMEVRWQ